MNEVWYVRAEKLAKAFDEIVEAINALPTFDEQCDAIKALNRDLYMNSKMLSLIEDAVTYKDTIAELQAKLQKRSDASTVTHTVTQMRAKAREETKRVMPNPFNGYGWLVPKEQDVIADYMEKHFRG